MKQLGRYFFPAVFTFLILIGAVVTYFSVRTTGEQLRASLKGRASSVSAFIDTKEIGKLSASASDINRPEYQDLKRRMVEAAGVNHDVRYVYLMGRDAKGVFFYGDSVDPKLTSEYSAPGDRYNEASPKLKAMFDNGSELVEGPTKDSFGTWLSGLSPVKDSNGKVVAVFGMDVAYANYRNGLIKSASIPIGVVALLSTMMWFGAYVRRREQVSFTLKAELVSIASHDLRSPLTGIEWAVNAIAEDTEPSSQPNQLARAVGAAVVELRNTVNTILQLAVEEKGIDTGLNCEDLSLRTMVEEVVTVFALPAEARNVKLVVDESLSPDVKVSVDKDKFKRALSNLINNAVKYTKANTTVTINYKKTATDHVLGVKDEGIGVPEADKAKILEGFHRAANAARSGIEGTGLGMILARRIIEAHGGTLTFDSTENVGTTFYLSLPIENKKVQLPVPKP
jgi:signal transduction histidine kinase